ncbi:trypco2 family protein [Pseudonocardia lacus]|uniref:trypco2 family protein n=1 Tax=Pseudonocardia lacus TaxID=2835865 RepID=UPI001BDD3E42|nr:trypco2 family protein [Pseudonocardia lacus]
MSDTSSGTGEVEGVGLAEAIASVRADLLAARLAGADAEIQLPVASLIVELTVVATKGVDGKAGFKVPFINAEVGGGASWKSEATQTVTVQFSEPVDRAGNPVKVASAGVQTKG